MSNFFAGGMATDFVAMWRGAGLKCHAHEDEGMPPAVLIALGDILSRRDAIQELRRRVHDGLLGGLGAGEFGGQSAFAEDEDAVADGQ